MHLIIVALGAAFVAILPNAANAVIITISLSDFKSNPNYGTASSRLIYSIILSGSPSNILVLYLLNFLIADELIENLYNLKSQIKPKG